MKTQKKSKNQYSRSLVCTWLSLLTLACSAVWAANSAQEGFRLYQAKDYSKALPYLRKASMESPRDLAICFYLGSSAAAVGDNNLAITAFSRLFVMCAAIDQFTCAAEPVFKRLRGSTRPYSCKMGNTLVRWHPKAMPIHIYLSDGKELPDGYAGQLLGSDKLTPYARSFHDPAYMNALQTAAGYNPSLKSAAVAGLAQWNWLATEKILSYQIVNSPADADVMVFWTANMSDKLGWTSYPASQGTSFPLASVPGAPVIIQLNTRANNISIATRAACHEFGHSFGLQHSKNPADIMYDTVGRGSLPSLSLSDSDILTIRALYQVPSDIWLMPCSRRK